MDPDIKKLIELTTIVKVEDNISRKVIYSDEYYTSRFQREHMKGFEKEQKEQVDLDSLVQNWKNKWQSFGDSWNKERQNYRFLHDSFLLFYYSFEQLRVNKINSINTAFDNNDKTLYFNKLSGVSLYGIYHHGKKCIDLLSTLNLISEKHTDWNFCKKFSETRNKLIEHNFNPYALNLQIDPSIWSLAGTNSLMEISIHMTKERVYDAYIDYYQDYYRLEKIITDIIKAF